MGSRFKEKKSGGKNGNRDLWHEITPCLWDFSMDGTNGMECFISHPLVKPIWRVKAGSVGRRVWLHCTASSACLQELLRADEGPFPADTLYSLSQPNATEQLLGPGSN